MKLEKQLKKELQTRLNQTKKAIKELKAINEILGVWYYKEMLTSKQLKQIENNEITLKELKKILIDREEKQTEKTFNKELKKINAIMQNDFSRWGKCSIDWVKNRNKENCPKGEYCNGFKYQEYKSVTGCGYCKLSTLTAHMLNDDVNLMSFIYNYVEKHAINKDNIQNKLGYGIRIYNGQPYFEGGVGVECHKRILEKMGFKVQHFSTKLSDIIIFERKVK